MHMMRCVLRAQSHTSRRPTVLQADFPVLMFLLGNRIILKRVDCGRGTIQLTFRFRGSIASITSAAEMGWADWLHAEVPKIRRR